LAVQQLNIDDGQVGPILVEPIRGCLLKPFATSDTMRYSSSMIKAKGAGIATSLAHLTPSRLASAYLQSTRKEQDILRQRGASIAQRVWTGLFSTNALAWTKIDHARTR
jgi:hypothetical protein